MWRGHLLQFEHQTMNEQKLSSEMDSTGHLENFNY
jgi:hypothetical protein